MFPLIAIGGVIGAVMSIGKGASWLADQISSTSNSASVGGKGDSVSQSGTKANSFEAALSAEVAGQKQPAAVTTASLSATTPIASGTDHDALARMRAGLLTYSYVGEQRDSRQNGMTGGSVAGS
jgi:hypothetical protein